MQRTEVPAAPHTVSTDETPDGETVAVDLPTLSAEAVYASLESSPRGLSAATVAARLASSGPNELPTARRPPIIGKVLAQFTNLFAIVLVAASVITFGSYLVQTPRDVGNLELAIAILCVVLLNAGIGFFQEYSAEKTAEALEAMVPHSARVRRDGETVDVAARELVRGDVFVLEAGDDVCCDGRLVEANGLTVDDVGLTGESAPVHRTAMWPRPARPRWRLPTSSSWELRLSKERLRQLHSPPELTPNSAGSIR